MKRNREVVHGMLRHGITLGCALLLSLVPLAAQQSDPNGQYEPYSPPPPEAQAAAPAQALDPQQLDNLVAPVALYPDPLLSQVLVAATYPEEIQQAAQWLQQNRGLQGQQLVDAARTQNWDPSVQALVVFPDVIGRMASNMSWTTDLGNAFLAQQADVMNAVQRMRAQAQAAGRLSSNAEQNVITDTQGGRSAIEIMPANPQVIYVPQYDPAYIWGPPAWGYYPDLYYPAYGFGFGFGPGIYLSTYFGGWGGWGWGVGGWGWGPNWFSCSIIRNGYFFNHYGFRDYGRYGGFARGGLWVHNPYHRMGVPYSNARLAGRFHGTYATGAARYSFAGQRGGSFAGSRYQSGGRSFAAGGAGPSSGWRHFGQPAGNAGRSFGGNRAATQSGGAASGGWQRFGNPSVNTGRGSSMQSNRGAAGGWQHFGQPGGNAVQRGGGYSNAYRSPSANGFGGSAPAMRQAPSYSRGFGGSAPAMRQAPSFSRGGGAPAMRQAPSFSRAPSFSGGSRPSFNGGGARSFGGGGGSRSFGGGGGAHMGGGGGGFHGGGGGSHGGGGGHGRR